MVRQISGISLAAALAVALLQVVAQPLWAGGGGHNVVLIVDPENVDSVYLANYYRAARDVPERNIFYFDPGAANYSSFVTTQQATLFGMLANKTISDHVDFILIMPTDQYRLSAPGLVSDGCSPVNNFSLGAGFVQAFNSAEVLAPPAQASTESNRYFAPDDTIRAFDSATKYLNGQPSASTSARQYFCAGMLGYTGFNGNTPDQLVALIDRSVAADFTRPGGTFYFMNNTADPARNVRNTQYAAVIGSLAALGATGETIVGTLPVGRDDVLGCVTGFAFVDIISTDMTILPGAFCDHLTSYAGYFDEPSQTKMSAWIIKGASGTCGTVEEPCNYQGKFPHSRMHLYYYKQLNLGEACFRSLQYTPYQPLMYGDLLTQPFAYKPVVSANLPEGTLSGTISFTPTGSTDRPNTTIARFELYVDGVFQQSVTPGNAFVVNTLGIPDGESEFRVVAIDSSLVETQWRDIHDVTIDNAGRSAALAVVPAAGGRNTLFTVQVSAAGAAVREIRLLANDRVFAATPQASAAFQLFGDMFGPGPVRLRAVAEFTDGRRARSPSQTIDVNYYTPAPGGTQAVAPVAYGFHKDVRSLQSFVLELPASDPETSALTYTVLSNPTQATVSGSGRTRIIRPNANASGTDTLTFRVNDGSFNSAPATIVLRYCFANAVKGDMDSDCSVTPDDLPIFIDVLLGIDLRPNMINRADFTGDGNADGADIPGFVNALL